MSRKLTRSDRLMRAVAGRTSATLAYTCFCLVALLYAVCIEKMPDQFLARVQQMFG